MQHPASATSRSVDFNGIDEPLIEQLVRTFYARAREDAVLGPVFAARIRDWEPHLQQIMAFWSNVMLKSGRYRGTPLQAHLGLAIDDAHFARWLALFERTARELCAPPVADAFVGKAQMIAKSLAFGIAAARGDSLLPADAPRHC
jgi:hemoglobin